MLRVQRAVSLAIGLMCIGWNLLQSGPVSPEFVGGIFPIGFAVAALWFPTEVGAMMVLGNPRTDDGEWIAILIGWGVLIAMLIQILTPSP